MYEDIYYSPVGPLLIKASEVAVHSISFDIETCSNSTNRITKHCKQQLDEYFSNKRLSFDLPLEPQGTTFQKKVWSQLQSIPFGKSMSYSELAISLGNIKVIRAAGTANGKNPIPIVIPCHRVMGKDGSLVGFAGGLKRKEWLLKHEGVIKGEQMNIFG